MFKTVGIGLEFNVTYLEVITFNSNCIILHPSFTLIEAILSHVEVVNSLPIYVKTIIKKKVLITTIIKVRFKRTEYNYEWTKS